MRVLIATRETQHEDTDDFCWTVEGELVRFPESICGDPDCGCDRSLAGMASSRATTTAKVVERDDIDAETFRLLLHDALVREGWVREDDAADRAWVQQWANAHLAAARLFEPGSVVEYRNGELWERTAA